LEYEKLNFNSFEEYVSNQEREDFIFTKNLYESVYNEMMSFYEQFSDKIVTKSLVHGNLNLSTIIENKFNFKFINFENCFYGSPFFDICNLVFEIQMNGINEHDFVSRSIYRLNLSDNRFLSNSYLKEYKICKFIWTRKRLLDLLKNYVKEVIILDKSRLNKILKIGSEFQKHFYRFDTILEFNKNRDVLAKKYHELILNG
jgi:5-methylthioribose kinase